MKKKIIAILMVLCLCCLSMPVAAQEAGDVPFSSDDVSRLLVERGLSAVAPRAVAYVTDFAGLEAAVADPTTDVIIILADIYMDYMLKIEHDITFVGITETTIYSASTDNVNVSRHFYIKGYNDVKLHFLLITLDGNGITGGITSDSLKSLTIENATLQNIYFNNSPIYTTAKSVNLAGCRINNNESQMFSGGLTAFNSLNVSVKDCYFSGNIGHIGGAIWIYGSQDDIHPSVTIENCEFLDNEARNHGGAIASFPLELDYINTINCHIENNKARYGGAIYIYGPDVITLTQTNLINNTAINGGGLYIENARANYISGIVSGNTAINGGGIYIRPLAPHLYHLMVGEDVVFLSNKAQTGYFTMDSYDISQHQQLILATQFTVPFEYGYNNYDIAYNRGIELSEVYVNFYESKSDEEPYKQIIADPGDVISLPAPPTLEGFTFWGWVDENNYFFDSSAPVTENQNLYALWIKN